MHKFTYASGDRPLDGYTIKRALGRGGFGEVYFALSDGGKEVALKLVRGDHAVELRGTNHCLNLKHPGLVHILDVRTDARGEPWVVMEYVNGETLDRFVRRHPDGVPPVQVARWFAELAEAVGYLHDQGIVHRDLKPSNVFLEDGRIRLTDFSLCKAVGGSERETLTQHVGTVHYMAPEIGKGNYGPSIDQYSAAVMLFELLTGRLPFDGRTSHEIIAKHLSDTPDLAPVPAGFRPVLKKALSKDPAARFADIRDMAKAVTAAARGEAVLDALPAPPPAPPRRPDPEPVLVAQPAPAPRPAPPREREREPVLDAMPAAAPAVVRLADVAGSLAAAAVLAAPAALLWATIAQAEHWENAGLIYFQTVAVAWSALVVAALGGSKSGDSWGRRLVQMVLGVGIGALTVWLTGWAPSYPGDALLPAEVAAASDLTWWDTAREVVRAGAGYASFFGLALGAMRWWRLADPRRAYRFSVLPIFLAGFWAALLLLVWPRPEWPSGAAAVVTAAALVQVSAPWRPAAPRPARPRRLRLATA